MSNQQKKQKNQQKDTKIAYVKKQKQDQSLETSQSEQSLSQQKFDQLFGGIQQTYKPEKKRKVYDSEQLLQKFTLLKEIDINMYKQGYLDLMDLFSQCSQQPENVQPQQNVISFENMQQRAKPQQIFKQQYKEEEEDEKDPEWMSFDPKTQKGHFQFGKEIDQTETLRQKAKQKKIDQQEQIEDDEDIIERLIRIQKEERSKQIKDVQFQETVDKLARDIEINEKSYSEIDLIFEKKQKSRVYVDIQEEDVLNDDQLKSLFSGLENQEEVEEEKDNNENDNNKTNLLDQGMNVSYLSLFTDDKEHIKEMQMIKNKSTEENQLILQEKPKFSAIQNLQKLFENYPVIPHEKHRIKLETIYKMKYEGSSLYKELMSSINPFSYFILNELENNNIQDNKLWELQPNLFQNNTENKLYQKSSAEMFKIYKYYSNPFISIKSSTYTHNQFVQIKNLFQKENLMEVSPLNVQINQNQYQNYNNNLQNQQQINQQQIQQNQQQVQQENQNYNDQQIQQNQEQEQQQDENQYENQQEYLEGDQLKEMENKLKQFIGFV